MKKIILISSAVILFTLAFTAPWLWIDNGEDIMESKFFRTQNQSEIFKNPYSTCECDGQCLIVKWVPFGVTADACSEDYYFISFWGQRFHINDE